MISRPRTTRSVGGCPFDSGARPPWRAGTGRQGGVLLARGAAGEQEAFTTLAATPRRTGRPVQEVARALVAAVAARNRRPAGG
jgi:hypothetical protein